MAEPTLPKGLGSIKWNDLFKGIYYAVIGQVLYLVGFFVSSLLQEHPVFPTWVEYLPYVKGIAYSIGGYMLGKFGVNNVGQILTRDKEVVQVAKATLDVLKEKADQKTEISDMDFKTAAPGDQEIQNKGAIK